MDRVPIWGDREIVIPMQAPGDLYLDISINGTNVRLPKEETLYLSDAAYEIVQQTLRDWHPAPDPAEADRVPATIGDVKRIAGEAGGGGEVVFEGVLDMDDMTVTVGENDLKEMVEAFAEKKQVALHFTVFDFVHVMAPMISGFGFEGTEDYYAMFSADANLPEDPSVPAVWLVDFDGENVGTLKITAIGASGPLIAELEYDAQQQIYRLKGQIDEADVVEAFAAKRTVQLEFDGMRCPVQYAGTSGGTTEIYASTSSPSSAGVGVLDITYTTANGWDVNQDSYRYLPLNVRVTESGGSYTGDATFAEIKAAYDAGRDVWFLTSFGKIPVLAADDAGASASIAVPNGASAIKAYAIGVSAQNVWDVTERTYTIPSGS